MKMTTEELERMYPGLGDDGYACDYTPLLSTLGNIVLRIDDSEYQGDSRILFRKWDSLHYVECYGILFFGWGSCSGCDSLQACSTYEEIEKLRVELEQNVTWFKSKKEAVNYFKTHDWEGDCSGNTEETRIFVQAALCILGGE